MISQDQAHRFAEAWIRAWNSHDLGEILSHYADNFEMTSPFIAKLMNEPTGTLRGKEKVRDYWGKALQQFPDLKFELIEVLWSVGTITIYYRSVLGRRAAEVMFLNEAGKVTRAIAHYNEP